MLDLLIGWVPVVGPLVVFALLVLVPGALILTLSGVRPALAVTLAPIVGTALAGGGGVVWSSLGVPWGVGPFLLSALVAAVVVAAARLLVQRSNPRSWWTPVRVSRRGVWWTVAGLAVNAVVVAGLYLRPNGSAQSVSYEYDTLWHFAVVRWILDTGDASSLHTGLLDGTVGNHFYPAAWHALVALTVDATGCSVATAVHASVLATLLITWPLGLALLTRTLFGPSALRTFAVTAIAFTCVAYPIQFLSFGLLYPNFFSYAMAPATLAVLVVGLRRLAAHDWPALRRAALPGLVLAVAVPVALLFAQPNSAFTLLVILLPLVYVTLWTFLGPTGSPRLASWVRPVALAAFTLVLAVAWVLAHDSSFLRRTVTVDAWTAFQTPSQAIGSWAFYGMYADGQLLLGGVTLAGLVLLLVRRQQRWWVVSWVLMGALFVVATAAAGGPGSLRNYLVGFWYADATRLAAAGAILGLPVVAYVVSATAERARSLWRARSTGGADVTAVVTAVAVVVLVVVAVVEPSMRERTGKIHEQSAISDAQWLSPAESGFLAEVAAEVSPGEVVANDPFDGSAMGYSLYDVDVLFRALPGNWMGTPSTDQQLVSQRLDEISTDPAVCRAAEQLGVRWVVSLDRGARGIFGDVPELFSGISSVGDATPGFIRVLHRGDLSLYAVEPCSPS